MAASIRFLATLSLFFAYFISCSFSLDSTDTITWGGSNDRTGYETNHNFDPAVVSSQQFGLLFRTKLPGLNTNGGPEQIFASPLVYTGADGVQYLYVATTLNNVYKINAKDGTIVASKNLGKPFLQTDLGTCTDISPNIGVTATGVIDAETGTWYLTSKTYVDQSVDGATGRPNARYYIHGISTTDLSERPNYPIDIEYTVARNNPLRSFTGGIHHQRPALLEFKDFIYAGFASHCIQYNYTGWLMGWNKASGKLVEAYAMEGSGVGPTVSGAGVWMSGGGLASNDVDSIFFSTGNGGASQLDQSPVSGRSPPTSLEEAAVHVNVNADGTITPVDFFMPWEKKQLDGADKDLGTSPLQLLPAQFSCGSIQRIGMVTGKSGKTYWLNMDDMGGYRNGPDRLDNIIQVYQHENSVYSGAGVYPLEGGYVYINVINYPTRVFQFTCQGGSAYFNPVALTNETNAGRLGVGHGSVTSLGQPGTGLLWVSDMDGSNLRIYNPVPQNGQMKLLNSFATPGVTKFSKLTFGNGVAYQITSTGYVYAYGSPVNLPLVCSRPVFPQTNINSTSAPQTIQCQAKTALTITSNSLPDNFLLQLPSLPATLAAGANFSFNATFTPKVVGVLTSSFILNTTQAAAGYTSTTQIELRGTSLSQAPVLAINPPAVTWNGVITGTNANQSVVFSNLGNATLQITSIKYSIVSEKGPFIDATGTPAAATVGPFTFYGMPSTVAPNSVWTVPINFNPTVSGAYAVYVRVESNGGTGIFDTFATGSEIPKALLEFETVNGSWTKFSNTSAFNFGNVQAGQDLSLRLRITNVGGPNAAPISITVSKPPFGIPGSILGANNGIDLGEGTLIKAGENKTATMFCAPPKSQINEPSYNQSTTWTMNLNDPDFGHTLINFICTAITQQLGPVDATGAAKYIYGGCFKDNNPGRQLQKQLWSIDNNTNEACINGCSAAGYIFAGTQFRRECWCGNNRPLAIFDDANCYFECTGDPTETCGGNGIDRAGTYISLFGDKTRWDGNTTTAPGPYTNPGTLGFASIGCWTDSTAARTLTVPKTDNDTVATCLQACKGYQYAGVEFGGECYCDNSIRSTGAQVDLTDCSQTCNNNYTEFCGGNSRLNLYQFMNTTSSSTTTTTTTTLLTTTTTPAITTTTTTAANTTTTAKVSTTAGLNSTSTTTQLSTTANSTTSRTMTTTTTKKGGALGTATVATTTTTSSLSSSLTTTTPIARTTTTTTTASTTTPITTATTSTTTSTTTTALTTTTTTTTTTTSIPTTTTTTTTTANPITTSTTTTPSVTTTVATTTTTTSVTTSVATSVTTSVTTSKSTTTIKTTTTTKLTTKAGTTTTTTPLTTLITTVATTTTTPITTTTTTTSKAPTGPPTVVSYAAPYSYIGCYSEATNIRALSASSLVSSSMTIEKCATFCNQNSYDYMAVEYGTECYCGNKINVNKGGVPVTDGRCSKACGGDASELCGGSYGLSMYTTNLPYVGCAMDQTPRTLGAATLSATDMTIEKCISFCGAYPLAGLEYGTECYCGFDKGLQLGQTGCNVACPGNAAETCGGSWRLSIYNNTLYVPTATKTNVGGYTYKGCFVDSTTTRALGGSYMADATSLTQESCVAYCKGKGFSVAGMEYGQECYCGNTVPTTTAPELDCSMECKGDANELCGASYRLSVFAA